MAPRFWRALLVIPAAAVALALGVLSAPWVLWGIGLFALGDEAAADRALEKAPLMLFFDYVERARLSAEDERGA